MGDPAGGTQTGGRSPAAASGSGPAPAADEPSEHAPSRGASRVRRWVAPVAGGVAIALLIAGGLGFLSASSDHSSRDTTNRKRHALLAAQVRADAARARIQTASDALGTQLEAEVNAANDLTSAQNAIVDAFDTAVGQANHLDTGGAQGTFQAQAGAVAALDARVTAERQALGQAQQRLRELQAAEQGR